MLVRRLIFSFWVILSIGAIVLSSYRNAARPVQGFVVHMDDQYPQMISKDSVDKMLTLVFKDSTSKRSGGNLWLSRSLPRINNATNLLRTSGSNSGSSISAQDVAQVLFSKSLISKRLDSWNQKRFKPSSGKF